MEKIENNSKIYNKNIKRAPIALYMPDLIAGEYIDQLNRSTDDIDETTKYVDIYCAELSDILDEEFAVKECVYNAMFRLTVLSSLVDVMIKSQYQYYEDEDNEYDFFSKVDYDRETKVFRAEITCQRR